MEISKEDAFFPCLALFLVMISISFIVYSDNTIFSKIIIWGMGLTAGATILEAILDVDVKWRKITRNKN